jgi:hypothetical protein
VTGSLQTGDFLAVPAKAGTSLRMDAAMGLEEIPAFAGMTE